ncbi:MAG TPA: hypothetical protein VHG08_26790 [Longimicrobium sp.]|nr:hypothetical protein [Longimicrobium sp.]
MDQHDAAIYRVVLASTQSRIVQRSTAGPLESMGDVAERIAMHADALPGLDGSTIRSFLARHRMETPVPDLGDSSIVWMSREEWRAFAGRRNGWAALDERHPGNAGVILLSRVGYASDGTQALVYVTTACPLCGSGEYVLLARRGNGWTITGRAQDWVS